MPISRLFSSAEDAQAAADDLVQGGFRRDMIVTLTKSSGAASAYMLERRGVMPANARTYAAKINQGQVLILADAQYGASKFAIDVLERPRAGDTGPVKAVYEGRGWDDSAPLSSMLNLPVQLEGSGPITGSVSMPLISADPTPVSSFLGLPLLSKSVAPLSSLIGLKLLAKNPTILSSMFGLPVLIR
jgi:hypothetical protein